MNIVSRLLTRSNLEWASLFVGFAVIWMVSGFFVQEPSPPALIEKKDPIVRVIDQKAENFSKEIVVKGFTKADKKVLVKSETSGKIVNLPIAQGTFVKPSPFKSRLRVVNGILFTKSPLHTIISST